MAKRGNSLTTGATGDGGDKLSDAGGEEPIEERGGELDVGEC